MTTKWIFHWLFGKMKLSAININLCIKAKINFRNLIGFRIWDESKDKIEKFTSEIQWRQTGKSWSIFYFFSLSLIIIIDKNVLLIVESSTCNEFSWWHSLIGVIRFLDFHLRRAKTKWNSSLTHRYQLALKR